MYVQNSTYFHIGVSRCWFYVQSSDSETGSEILQVLFSYFRPPDSFCSGLIWQRYILFQRSSFDLFFGKRVYSGRIWEAKLLFLENMIWTRLSLIHRNTPGWSQTAVKQPDKMSVIKQSNPTEHTYAGFSLVHLCWHMTNSFYQCLTVMEVEIHHKSCLDIKLSTFITRLFLMQ